MELINVTIHGDGNKHPQTAYKLFCSNKDNCSIFREKHCIMASMLMNGHDCPYGQKKWETGYTTRAAKHWDWYHEIHSLPQYNALQSSDGFVHVVGGDELIITTDMIEFRKALDDDDKSPYAYVDGYLIAPCWHHIYEYHDDEFKKNHRFETGFRIKLSDLTPGIVDKLFSLTPRGLFSYEEIKSYKTEVLRDLKIILKKYAPHLLKEPVSYVGKKAKLKTVNPGKIKLGNNHWASWDGEYIHDNDKPLWASFKSKEIDSFEAKIKPNDEFLVEITSDDQVNENTIFMG